MDANQDNVAKALSRLDISDMLDVIYEFGTSAPHLHSDWFDIGRADGLEKLLHINGWDVDSIELVLRTQNHYEPDPAIMRLAGGMRFKQKLTRALCQKI